MTLADLYTIRAYADSLVAAGPVTHRQLAAMGAVDRAIRGLLFPRLEAKAAALDTKVASYRADYPGAVA